MAGWTAWGNRRWPTASSLEGRSAESSPRLDMAEEEQVTGQWSSGNLYQNAGAPVQYIQARPLEDAPMAAGEQAAGLHKRLRRMVAHFSDRRRTQKGRHHSPSGATRRASILVEGRVRRVSGRGPQAMVMTKAYDRKLRIVGAYASSWGVNRWACLCGAGRLRRGGSGLPTGARACERVGVRKTVELCGATRWHVVRGTSGCA